MSYWKECVSCAFDEAGIQATEEQIDSVARAVEGGHENYGMAHGHECIPNPLQTENDRLKSELESERDKVVCRSCNGHGSIRSYWGPSGRSSTSQCDKCNGEGYLSRRQAYS